MFYPLSHLLRPDHLLLLWTACRILNAWVLAGHHDATCKIQLKSIMELTESVRKQRHSMQQEMRQVRTEWGVGIRGCALTGAVSPLSCFIRWLCPLSPRTSLSCSVLTAEGRLLLHLWSAFSCFHCGVTDVHSGAWKAPSSPHSPCSLASFSP